MSYKSLEICYDIAQVPEIDSAENAVEAALSFRNAAMDLMEAALTEAGLGEWAGAEIGEDDLTFGFEVDDFDAAEAAVRAAVAGTPFENIREINRFEDDEEDDEDDAGFDEDEGADDADDEDGDDAGEDEEAEVEEAHEDELAEKA